MTVAQLLTGRSGPLSNAEFVEWVAFSNVRASKQKQAQNRSRGRGRRR